MGSDQGKQAPSTHDSHEMDPDKLAEEITLAQWARRGPGAMRVREVAVMPFRGVSADEDRYPEMVHRILGHIARVMHDIDQRQADIQLLREDTRRVLARLKAA